MSYTISLNAYAKQSNPMVDYYRSVCEESYCFIFFKDFAEDWIDKALQAFEDIVKNVSVQLMVAKLQKLVRNTYKELTGSDKLLPDDKVSSIYPIVKKIYEDGVVQDKELWDLISFMVGIYFDGSCEYKTIGDESKVFVYLNTPDGIYARDYLFSFINDCVVELKLEKDSGEIVYLLCPDVKESVEDLLFTEYGINADADVENWGRFSNLLFSRDEVFKSVS